MNMNWEEQQAILLDMLLSAKSDEAVSLTRELLNQGAAATEFFEQCATPVLLEIGKRFETLDIFLPEMVVAAEIVQEINDQVINPALEAGASDERSAPLGKVLLATVQGDLHDIGKSMVALMLKVNGFEVVDMGIDVAPSAIIQRAQQEQVDIIGLSTLLTTCLPYVKDTIDYFVEKGIRDKYAIIIGGAAPTSEFAARVGVDAYGHSAAEAVTICRELTNKQR